MKKAPIIFDLFGVIFYINKWHALKYLGPLRIIKYVIKCRKNPIQECFAILDKMRLEEPGEYQDLVAYEDIYLPLTFCQWLKGEKTTQEALEKLHAFIKLLEHQQYFCSKEHREMINRLINIIADPDITIKLIYAAQPMVKLLSVLKTQGHQCYILSNIDTQTNALLQQHFADILKYFDGHVVSCQVHLLKPQKEIFLEIQKKFGLSPQECIYIDDQNENVEAAQNVGMKGILFKNKSVLAQALKPYL